MTLYLVIRTLFLVKINIMQSQDVEKVVDNIMNMVNPY